MPAANEPFKRSVKQQGEFKIITDYKTNDQGQTIKVTQKVKEVKVQVSAGVAERQKWKKFGDCAGLPAGPDSNSTTVGEPVYLKLSSNAKDIDAEEDEKLKKTLQEKSKILCRNCNGPHWTTKCPYQNTEMPAKQTKKDEAGMTLVI
jgi:translation initiation factor 3 subunit G